LSGIARDAEETKTIREGNRVDRHDRIGKIGPAVADPKEEEEREYNTTARLRKMEILIMSGSARGSYGCSCLLHATWHAKEGNKSRAKAGEKLKEQG